MNTIKVDKNELLNALRKNFEKHKLDLDEMAILYRKNIIEALGHLTNTFVSKKVPKDILEIAWPRFPPKPSDHLDDYLRAIEMVKMSVDSIIELSESEFVQLVLDQWTWKREFEMTKTVYGI